MADIFGLNKFIFPKGVKEDTSKNIFPFLKRKSIMKSINIPSSFEYYSRNNHDLVNLTDEKSLLSHYIVHGNSENRPAFGIEILPKDFNPKVYSKLNPDLKNAGLILDQNLINHYITCGMKEKRRYNYIQPVENNNFDVVKYIPQILDKFSRLELTVIDDYVKKCKNKNYNI